MLERVLKLELLHTLELGRLEAELLGPSRRWSFWRNSALGDSEVGTFDAGEAQKLELLVLGMPRSWHFWRGRGSRSWSFWGVISGNSGNLQGKIEKIAKGGV